MWAGDLEREDDLRAALKSYVDWWALAGVTTGFAETPQSWLEAPRTETDCQTVPPATRFPGDLAALQQELAKPCDLPGASGARQAVPPVGLQEAPVMLVGDCPSAEDERAGRPLSGLEGQLADAMLRAMSVSPDEAYRALTASCRPASGRLSPDQLDDCGKLLRHHILLARPRTVVLLGATPVRALFGSEPAQARGRLLQFNQDGVTLPLVATHHPRTMLRRPELKAQAWADLLLLVRTLNT